MPDGKLFSRKVDVLASDYKSQDAIAGTLLVRKLIPGDLALYLPDIRERLNRLMVGMDVYVGDVVVKDPTKPDKHFIQRIAVVEGCEMASTSEKDEPFVLEKRECWILADNQDLKPMHAYDNRTFGPVSMKYIIGRVIYCLRNHGQVNSFYSKQMNLPVLEVEMDINEMSRHHKQYVYSPGTEGLASSIHHSCSV